MKKSLSLLCLLFLCALLPGCGTPAYSDISAPTDAETVAAAVTSTRPAGPTTPAWSLGIQLDPARKRSLDLVNVLSQLTPGSSTLQDLYRQAGFPGRKKDLESGIALLYPSLWPLYPHTVLVDGTSGVIRFIAIENISLHLFNLRNVQSRQGLPVKAGSAADYPDGFERLFFPGTGTAVIMDRKYPAQIVYVQKFPESTSLEEYQAQLGYLKETYAFAPDKTAAPDPTSTAAPEPQPTLVPLSADPQRIEFESLDGTPLVGTYYPARINPAPIVVLMHWLGGSRQDWNNRGMVEWLRNRGLSNPNAPEGLYPSIPKQFSLAVFVFDYRGHGESSWINGDSEGWLLDGLAAMETVKSLPGVDSQRLIAMGASIGADGAADACGEGCLGALSLSPNNYLGVPYHDAVAALDFEGKPAWCMASVLDMGCPSRASGNHYRAIVYPGQRHGMNLLDPGLEPNAGQMILDFLLLCLESRP